MNKSDFIRNWITENAISDDIPSRTIAKRLVSEYVEIFENVENTRQLIRYIRGNNGEYKRNVLINSEQNKKYMRENRNPEIVGKEWNLNPIDISIKDYDFSHKKPLILSDIHLPYHDLKAVLLAIEYGINKGCDSIYLNGDILDCYKLSSFTKRPDMISFSEEREMFWSFIDFLKTETKLPIYFKVGNHEERWNTYLMKQAPELFTLHEFALKQVLKLDEIGIEYVGGRQICNMGKLMVIHGHEFGESIFSPVNPARGLFLKAKCSVLAGHNHQTSEHHENNLKGDSMACFSVGSLCQLTPEYRPFAFTKWNLGFAVVEVDEDKSFHVDNLRIIDGKVR